MSAVQCGLCPKNCYIADGETGDCRIRINLNGTLHAVTYGHPCAVHLDPVEKKPLFHFYPGSSAFSVATAGCNLHCRNCQNWEISQQFPADIPAYNLPPDKIISQALKYKCRSIAYTYSEPCIFYEYTLDCSVKARDKGIKNILVTAAYLNKKPMKELFRYTDAANIDLKAFSDSFYRKVCGGTLKPVLQNLELALECSVELEVTNLLIPGLNDKENMINDLCRWHAEYLGKDIPLHFSRFAPRYKMKNLPPTPAATLGKAAKIAKSYGLRYVYVGNLASATAENTYCPVCGKLLVERRVYTIKNNVLKNGKCPYCGEKIYGCF